MPKTYYLIHALPTSSRCMCAFREGVVTLCTCITIRYVLVAVPVSTYVLHTLKTMYASCQILPAHTHTHTKNQEGHKLFFQFGAVSHTLSHSTNHTQKGEGDFHIIYSAVGPNRFNTSTGHHPYSAIHGCNKHRQHFARRQNDSVSFTQQLANA